MDSEEDLFDVVISGISGIFPESDNVEQLKENLLAKRNLVNEKDCRWNIEKWKVPAATGKISVVQKFDDTFFGIFSGVSAMMDPLTRVTIERAYEAVMDAGINPKKLRNSYTAVYTASGTSDSEAVGCDEKLTAKFWLVAHVRALLANRISYVLNLKGPSWTIDSTWIGGIECLKQAVHDIRKGRVENALVGVSNVILFPHISQHWVGLNKLSADGTCSPFEENANGYGRSEAVVFFFLQRETEANRIYATVSKIDAMFCGDDAETLLKPSVDAFIKFLRNFYEDQPISKPVAFLEADGSADKYLDEIELNSIGTVLCDEKKNKNLYIGGVKSNLGHTEAASPLVSLTKAVISMDTEIIPPNRKFVKANQKIEKLRNNEMKILTESISFPEGVRAAVNTIGLCSSIGHVLLDQHRKKKKFEQKEKQVPRLVLVSARHEPGLFHIINKLETMPHDNEYFSMVNDVFRDSIPGHFFKGFTILGATEKKMHFTLEIGDIPRKRSVWYVFAGMGSQWPGMGADFMRLPVFAAAIKELDTYLSPLDIDIVDVISNYDPTVLKNIVHCFVGIIAVQIGLVDLMRAMGIEPDGMFGHSLGETMCAYVDGCFNKYQAIMAAYYRGRASSEISICKGLMVAVGLHYSKVTNLPPNCEIACHNSYDNTTISGPLDEMQTYIEELKRQNIFARAVDSNYVAYHSKQVLPLASFVLENIRKAVPHPKKRSSRWISTSVKETEWDSPLAHTSSAEYHVHNFLNTVYFAEACSRIPEDALVVEISPHGLFQGILKRSVPDSCLVTPLGKRETSSSLNFFLSSVGKLFVIGLKPDVNAIYPNVEYPVSRNTPSLATLATWNHEHDWEINVYQSEATIKPLEVSLRKPEWRFLTGYTINDKVLMPFSLLLTETLKVYETNNPTLVFENVHVFSYAEITANDAAIIDIQVQYGSGNFEITKDNKVLLNGTLRYSEESIEPVQKTDAKNMNSENFNFTFSKNEIQTVLKEYSMNISDKISDISEIMFTENGCTSLVTWSGKLAEFVNAIATIKIFWDICLTNKGHILTSKFLKFAIETEKYEAMEKGTIIELHYDRRTNVFTGPGVLMIGLENSHQPCFPSDGDLMVQNIHFVEYENPQTKSLENFFMYCGQVVGENLITDARTEKVDTNFTLKVLLTNDLKNVAMLKKHMSRLLEMILRELPQIQFVVKYVSYEDLNNLKHYGNRWTGFFIVCKSAIDVSKFVESLKNVFLLSLENVSKLSDHFVKITEERVGSYNACLWRRKVSAMETVLKIKPYSNKHWKEDLEKDLCNVCTRNQVCLEWYSKNIMRAMDVVYEVNIIRPVHVFRYIILMDDEPSKCVQQNSPNYKQHMEKGLTMNVYKGGKWGSVKHLLVTNPISPTFTQSFVKRSKNVREISIEYVTLSNDLGKQNERRIFEFSGLSLDRKRVMGVAEFKKKCSTDIETFLQWPVPDQWALEDAVTVPLPYVKAYYALAEKAKLTRRSKILVHRGYSILGEACIAVALSFECTVFTFIADPLHGKYLKERFLHSKQLIILNSKSQHVDIEILKLTKKSGVNVIINPETETELRQSLQCTQYFGKVVVLSRSHLKLGNEFGMEAFAKSATLYSVINEEIINSEEKIKAKIHKWLNDAVKCGTVRPFKSEVHRSDEIDVYSNHLNSDRMRRNVIKIIDDKMSTKSNIFLCDPKKLYLVIGRKTEIWFIVVTWLIQNNAKKFVFIEESTEEFDNQYAKRFNWYFANRNDLSFMYLSPSTLHNERNAAEMIREINSYAPLDAAFSISLNCAQCSNLDHGIRQNTSIRQLIYLQCDAFDAYESRIESRLPVLNIIWDRSINGTDHLTQNIRRLFENALTINLSLYLSRSLHFEEEFKNSLNNVESQFLPKLTEMEQFINGFSTQASFEKMISKCSYFNTRTQILPVFILPGLHSEKLRPLIKKIMYPVYCAKYPITLLFAKDIAKSLLQPLKKIQPKGPYTIVGESWSGVIAVELVALLEQEDEEGKVNLILIEGLPKNLQERLSAMGSFGSSEFLTRTYGENENIENLRLCSDKKKIQFIELLQRKLSTVNNYSSEKAFLRSKTFAMTSTEKSVLDAYTDFETHYGSDLEMKTAEECNYENLLDNTVTAHIINENVLFKW